MSDQINSSGVSFKVKITRFYDRVRLTLSTPDMTKDDFLAEYQCDRSMDSVLATLKELVGEHTVQQGTLYIRVEAKDLAKLLWLNPGAKKIVPDLPTSSQP